ncbi:MAG: alpha/beta hydrolase [Planctomycetota bacterium]
MTSSTPTATRPLAPPVLTLVAYALLLLPAAAALTSCSSFERQLNYGELDSAAMLKRMDYAVYTPPGWSPNERLPLVLFLHGGGDSEDCFDRHGISPYLDEAIRSGEAPRVVICIPNGERGFWENFEDGTRRYRDWVIDDLLPHVRREYRTLPGRANTHVFGISMGGHGTLRMLLRQPELFASACAISAPIMDAEHIVEFTKAFWVKMFVPVERIWGATDDVEKLRRDDLFVQWQEPEDLRGVRFMFAYGSEDRDGIIQGNEHFHEHLDDHAIPHEFLRYDGRHKWVDWKPIFPQVLRFLRADS